MAGLKEAEKSLVVHLLHLRDSVGNCSEINKKEVREDKFGCVPKKSLIFERFLRWWNSRSIDVPPTEPERHLPFFKLWDAFEKRECPLCYLCRKARNLYLSNFYYEQVNDVGMRNNLHCSIGFSPDATSASVGMGADMGLSIIYRSLTEDIADRLHAHESIVPSQPCPITEHVKTMNKGYVQQFTAHYVASDFQNLHERSFGLCLQHIQEVLQILLTPELRQKFIAIEEEKFRQLHQELDTFLSKTDYQNNVPFGAERDAWMRAAMKLHRDERF